MTAIGPARGHSPEPTGMSLSVPSLGLVIFDCDGVLIDSETVASRVVAQTLTRDGWSITPREAQQCFMGMTLTDMEPLIASRLGRPLDDRWRARLSGSLMEAMRREAVLVDGAIAALDAADALGLPWRVASNSSHEEMDVKFGRTGLAPRVRGRAHSHRDVARGKPAPDVFLAAAAAEGVAPARCLVIEDSATGAIAARAAGMRCLGVAASGDGAALKAAGAMVVRSMHEVAALLMALGKEVDA